MTTTVSQAPAVKKLINVLFDIEAVKFGNFTLKSGIQSPIYIDLRILVSYPKVLAEVAEAMLEKVDTSLFDILCGVPYTALPLATALSLSHDIPMVIRRKEVKDYGTKKAIEGKYTKGQKCLILEDLITSGSSVFETVAPLEHEGLVIKDIVVLLDREQGGKKKITDKGYNLHSVITMSTLIEGLEASGRITGDTAKEIRTFIEQNQL